MAMLGVAEDYEAVIVDSATQEVMGALPWSSIKWQRVDGKISGASVLVAEADGGIDCCAMFGGLRAWSQMLRIERNGYSVWDGPILSWGRANVENGSPRDVTIQAKDRFAISMKRLVGVDFDAVNAAPEVIFQQLTLGANIGNPAFDPYPLLVNGAPGLLTRSQFNREYRIARLERVSDCIDELARTAGLYWTTFRGVVLSDEYGARSCMGGLGGNPSITQTYAPVYWNAYRYTQRPALNENTAYAIPGVEFDGESQVTSVFVGGASQGDNGFPLIGDSQFWSGQYVSGTLEAGYTDSRSTTLKDLEANALIKATDGATGKVTVEQVGLTPLFGADINEILPGGYVDVDLFEETCAFNLPIIDVRYEPRDGIGTAVDGKFLTPAADFPIKVLRLVQLDVDIARDEEGGVSEQVLASFTPTAIWDGVLPTGWFDPTIEVL